MPRELREQFFDYGLCSGRLDLFQRHEAPRSFSRL